MTTFREFFDSFQHEREVIQAYHDNPSVPVSEIARQFGKTETDVYRILKSHGFTPNRLKLHHEKVKQLASLGWSLSHISELTGYTTRNVRYILDDRKE